MEAERIYAIVGAALFIFLPGVLFGGWLERRREAGRLRGVVAVARVAIGEAEAFARNLGGRP